MAASSAPPDAAVAETHYHYALTLAQTLGMCSRVAHCHLGLGILYGRLGQVHHATHWLFLAQATLAQTA